MDAKNAKALAMVGTGAGLSNNSTKRSLRQRQPRNNGDTLGILLGRLDRVQEVRPGVWKACCSAHDDRSPSLSIKETADGTILLKCWAGCGAADVVAAVGLTLADLFPASPTNYRPTRKGERWIPRDAVAALAHELWVVALAGAATHAGLVLSEQERDRLMLALRRLWGAFAEVTR